MNLAQLHFRYTSTDPSSLLTLYGVSEDCHLCLPQLQTPTKCPSNDFSCAALSPNITYDFSVNGVFTMNLELRSFNNAVWEGSYHFVEYSDYSMQGQELESGQVHASIVLNKAGDPYIPLIVLGVLFGLWFASCFGIFFWKQNAASNRSEDEDDSTVLLLPPQPSVMATSSRVVSLDVFRGITISIMIFVNYGGGGYWILSHSTWNGLTIADLVFPWFAWIMGVSIAIGLSKKKFALSRWTTFQSAAIRSLKLFCLGLFINNGYDLSVWRIPGVLQSFGASYLIVMTVILATNFNWILQVVAMTTVVASQLLIVFCMPVNDCPTGYIGPGGIGDYGKFPTCTGGAHRAVDIALFGLNHILKYPTSSSVYQSPSFDPEGFLNWFMVALATFLGYSVGRFVMQQESWKQKASIIGGSGLVFSSIGLILCHARVNDGWIPINKNLWSISFVLVTSGLASMLFAILFLMVDVFDIWSGRPFLQAGMNSILLYCGHELLQSYFPFGTKHNPDSHAEAMLSNLLGAMSWLFIAHILHRKKIFLTV